MNAFKILQTMDGKFAIKDFDNAGNSLGLRAERYQTLAEAEFAAVPANVANSESSVPVVDEPVPVTAPEETSATEPEQPAVPAEVEATAPVAIAPSFPGELECPNDGTKWAGPTEENLDAPSVCPQCSTVGIGAGVRTL